MPVIRKLSAEIIGQIAAGEVVERPASAVKELVENSIDAGAHNVTVELREGGIKYLRVTDNGCGIPAEQVRLAFERHATSKIAVAADLYNIHTLGFRGEALASIAAVSRVTLTTRTQEAPFGTRAVVEAGEFTDIRQAASPVGTTIVVEDLFCNTPVRLKFLKKPAVEASLVADYMQRLILSRPDVAFRFVSQGKTVYHSMGDGSIESALYSLYGREAFGKMRKASGHMNGVLLSGYVGAGDLARGNRQQQSFFVNGRFFRSQPLSRALEEGCEGQVMVGRFPMCALFLEVPVQQVDVNVHPNKLEVRFQNEPAVAEAVRTLVREAMRGETLGERLSAAQSAPSNVEPKSDFSLVRLDNPLDGQVTPAVQAGGPQSGAGPVADAAPELRHPVLTEAQKQELAALEPVVIPDAPARSAMAQSAAPPAVALCLARRFPCRKYLLLLHGSGHHPPLRNCRPYPAGFPPDLRRVRTECRKSRERRQRSRMRFSENLQRLRRQSHRHPVRTFRPCLNRSSKPLRRKTRHRARRFGWWASCSIPTGSLNRATGCSLWTSMPRMSACSTTG